MYYSVYNILNLISICLSLPTLNYSLIVSMFVSN